MVVLAEASAVGIVAAIEVLPIDMGLGSEGWFTIRIATITAIPLPISTTAT
jgi:hypothetical protein